MSDLTVLLLHLIIGYIIFHCYRHTDGHTDTASSHSEGFLRNLHKKRQTITDNRQQTHTQTEATTILEMQNLHFK